MSYNPNSSGVHNTTPPTLTDAQSSAIQLDVNGNTKVAVQGTVPVSGSVSVSNLPATQAVSTVQLPAAVDGNGYLKVHEQGTAEVNVTNGSLAVTGTFYPATQPVSVASMPTTPVKPDGSVWALSGTSADVNVTNTVPVSGTFWQATQPVSVASPVIVAQSTAADLNATVTLAPNQTVTDVPATSGGWSTNVQQALTTYAQVKAPPGQLGGYAICNPNTNTVYVFFYDTTSAPTIGDTTDLIYQIGIPAGGAAHIEFGKGIAFASGIYVATSTSATGPAYPATGLVVTSLYK